MQHLWKRVVAGLAWRRDALVRRLPRPIATIIEHRQLASRVRNGHTNFDTDRLTDAFAGAWERLLAEMPAEELGDYHEFGVYFGSSMACMHTACTRLGLDHVRLFGYDSFEGLPRSAAQEDGGFWKGGQFKSALWLARDYLASRGVPTDRVTLVKGWFSDTLSETLKHSSAMKRAGVVMVDCDLYSSTLEALRFLRPMFDRPVILFFDDWNAGHLADKGMGERKAFEEFLAESSGFDVTDLPELNYKSKEDVRVVLLRPQPAPIDSLIADNIPGTQPLGA